MSQQNVQLLRLLIERWNAGGRELQPVAGHLDAAVELDSPFSSVAGAPYRGHAGMDEWIRDIDEQFAEWRMAVREVREIGDAAVAIGNVHGRGRASGIIVDVPAALVAHFGADGLITRISVFLDVAEAMRAAGLAD